MRDSVHLDILNYVISDHIKILHGMTNESVGSVSIAGHNAHGREEIRMKWC